MAGQQDGMSSGRTACQHDGMNWFQNGFDGVKWHRWRWLVERTFAWIKTFRRVQVRHERIADVFRGFL